MCRMIGITNFDYKTHKTLLADFLMLAKTGMVPPGNQPGHIDGWGIGYYSKEKAHVVKSVKSILKEKTKVFDLLKKIGSSKTLILHLRKSAWKNTNLLKNTHPFNFLNTIYCHNGTVIDYKPLIKHIPKEYVLSNDPKDSEVFFKYALSRKDKTLKAKFNSAFKQVEHFWPVPQSGTLNNVTSRLGGIAKSLDHTSLSSLFSDGDKLYAYREFTRLPAYYTLFLAKLKNSSIVCSEKLGTPKWKLLKEKKIVVY